MDIDGRPMHLYGQVKNGLFKIIKEKQSEFYQKIRNIKR